MNRLFRDESAFDILDEEKTAMLGLLMADACLSPFHGPHLRLSFSQKDVGPLITLKKMLRAGQKIGVLQPKIEPRRTRPYYQIHVCGLQHLGVRLQELGLTHPKPTRCPRGIPEDLSQHFIRGYFDGDGSVWWDGHHKVIRSDIAGYKPMLDWMISVLGASNIVGGCYSGHGCLRLVFYKRSSAKLYHYLYDDATTILNEAKKSRFEQLLARSNNLSEVT